MKSLKELKELEMSELESIEAKCTIRKKGTGSFEIENIKLLGGCVGSSKRGMGKRYL